MALATTTRSYIGKGRLYAGKKTGGLGLIPIGNVSQLTTAISEEKKELLDYTTAGGGVKDTLTRISGIEGTMIAHDFSPENLALALRGGVTTSAAGSVAAETTHTGYTNAFVPFDYLPDVTATVTPAINVSASRANSTAYVAGDCILASAVVYQCTTAGTSAGSAPTFNTTLGATTTDGTAVWTSRGAVTMVDGTDYELGKAGLHILSTASRFALGLPLTIAYTKTNAEIVQMLVASADDYMLFFDGLNEIDSGNPTAITMHRVRFGVTAGLDMIADDFGKLEIKFDILQDTTVSGTGISQYLKIAMVAG